MKIFILVRNIEINGRWIEEFIAPFKSVHTAIFKKRDMLNENPEDDLHISEWELDLE
jgi:hypothetical protein